MLTKSLQLVVGVADGLERVPQRGRGRVLHELEALRAREHEREPTARLLVPRHEREQLPRRDPRRVGYLGGQPERVRQRLEPVDDIAADPFAPAASAPAKTSPIATASPCVSSWSYAISSAWASVCPRLSVARNPVRSCGSRATTSALIAAQRATTSASTAGSRVSMPPAPMRRRSTSPVGSSTTSNISAYFATSPRPLW